MPKNNLKIFLNLLEKLGYPNPKLYSISEYIPYNLRFFLTDLYNELGEKKTIDFVKQAFSKLSTDKGIKVDLNWDEKSYVYMKIKSFYIEKNEDDDDKIYIIKYNSEVTESLLLTYDEDGNEVYKTLDEISDDVGMGDWGEYDEFIDSIFDQFEDELFWNCGFVCLSD